MDFHGPRGEAIGTLVGFLLQSFGIMLLRLGWGRRNGSARITTIAGWMVATMSMAIYARIWGVEVGTALALITFSALAYFFVAVGIELRSEKQQSARELALEPEDRSSNWWRAIGKSALAIVLAGIAAIGIGVAFAVAMPISATDRIVIGGLLVPMLWGAGMAWTLSDAKLVRAALLLCLVSAFAYSVAFLPKVLAS